jgi:hypothetical protein
MSGTLSFSQLAAICLALSEAHAPASTPTLQQTLRQGVSTTRDALETACEKEYVVEVGSGMWALAARGERLAAASLRAVQETRVETAELHANPYTDFLPTGREDLT